MLHSIAQKLFKLHFGYLLFLSVLVSEIFTSFMSILLRGSVTLDYLITGGVVSLLVASLLIYFIKYSSELTQLNRNLQNEINHREKIEATLTKSSRDWKTTFDATKDMIFMLDKDHSLIKINQAAAHFLQKKIIDVIGENFFDLFHELVPSGYVWPLDRIQHSKKHEESELYIV